MLTCAAIPAAAEQRQRLGPSSPPWLLAVGKLQVPGSKLREGRRRHLVEDCSATLVRGEREDGAADIVITAWHCLEHYNDLSRPILFTLRHGESAALQREVRRLADGGSMAADWAILRMVEPVPASLVPGLPPGPAPAPGSSVTMAGYSGDPGLGDDGGQLTYHAGCAVTGTDRADRESDCRAMKGASGGAVIQLDARGDAQLAGVISRGDGERTSLFVPIARFRAELNRFL